MAERNIQDRNFLNGALVKLEKAIGSRLDGVGQKIETLANKVLRVRVENFPTPKTYEREISRINKNIEDAVSELKRLVDRKDPEALQELAKLDKLVEAIGSITIPEPPQFDTSNLEKATGNVEQAIKGLKLTTNVDMAPVVEALGEVKQQLANIKLPEPVAYNNDNLVDELRSLQKNLLTATGQSPTPTTINLDSVIEKLDEMVVAVSQLPTTTPEMPEFSFPDSISVNNFPPQKIPQPVTNINVNPLRGIVHSTSTTVGTGATALPGYGVLDNRRAIVFYNTSEDTTIYIGGPGVSASNGLPVPASSYSPSFDSGPSQLWYAVADSGSVDVRTVELQNDSGG